MFQSKGFTLIETLVVIAVIGVLAVAVLSAINPIEQMRKARDARRKSNGSELLNAIERYYATNHANPPSLATATRIFVDVDCENVLSAGAIVPVELADLTATEELKSEFETRIGTENELYVAFDENNDLAIVCFEIECAANKEKYAGEGCLVDTRHYICIPE